MENKSLEYQLGVFIGEFIIGNYLPTLNIDSLLTHTVINVTEDEKNKYDELNDLWFKSVRGDKDISNTNWNNMRRFQLEMENKYLPPVIECYVPGFDVQDYVTLKEGIRESLWDSDLCHYSIDVDNIDINEYDEKINYHYPMRRLIKLMRKDE